jgi:LPPG:FO 2-phospho-L-lactate transferase
MLQQGKSLTEVTQHLATRLGIRHAILPMSDQSVRTHLETNDGILGFQEYFVRERWQPVVSVIHFSGLENAHPSPAVKQILANATLIVFGPSNPFLSIDPILALPGIRDQIAHSRAPCVAVSPIIGGQAVKGPAAKLMAELGHDVTSFGIAKYYKDLLKGVILDTVDSRLCEEIETLNVRATAQNTLMTTLVEKTELAASLLQWTEEIS